MIANSISYTSLDNSSSVGTPTVVRPTLSLTGISAGITAVSIFAVAGSVEKMGTDSFHTAVTAAGGLPPGDNSLPTLDIITVLIKM